MPRFDVTAIGEGQLRYCIPAGQRLEMATQLDMHVTGTELNVLCTLSRLGWQTGWVSSLPDSPLGRKVTNTLRLAGVDLTAVSWSDKRLATYYVEFAHPPRSSQVYYDRADTAFTNLTAASINWDYLLDTRLLHLSGLTVPLSPTVNEILLTAVSQAKSRQIPISFDMNYRHRVWTTEAAALGVQPFMENVDLLFFPKRDAELLYGITGTPEQVVQQLAERTSAKHIVVSLGAEGIIGWDGRHFYTTPARKTIIVDRIGAGDAMVAGVLHGWLQGDFAKGLRYGATTAALTLSQFGDQPIINKNELDTLLDEPGGDIVR